MVQHIVLMKARPDTSDDQMKQLLAELAALQGKIDGIASFTGGKDISGGARTQGMTHGFVMTFTDAARLQAYLPHPEHQQVAARVRALCDGVLVFDYEC